MYIYVANETNDDINVYFDNLTITHTGLQVVEHTDYYPYGMVMRKETPSQGQGVYSRYRYGYQGQFAEKDEETGWNHFELRQYGSRIGRWTATDPYRQYASPYVGMGNNPVSNIDPDGGISIPDLSFLLNDPVFQSLAGGSIFLDNVDIFAQNGGGADGGPSDPTIYNWAFTGFVAGGKGVKNVLSDEIVRQGYVNMKAAGKQGPVLPGIKMPKSIKFLGKFGGTAFTAWSVYDVEQQFKNGEINSYWRKAEQGSNAIGAIPVIGTGWSIGWEIGRWITQTDFYRYNIKGEYKCVTCPN